MKKEVYIAIIIGFVLGLLITGGVWLANKTSLLKPLLNPGASTQKISENNGAATPIPTVPPLLLTITSPQNHDIYDKETINVSGSTSQPATIVILYNEGEKIIETDKDGNFTADITLIAGANEITISAHDESGNEVDQKLEIIFSTAVI